MILPAMERLQTQLSRLGELRRARDQADDLRRTHGSLATIVAAVEAETHTLRLLGNRLLPSERAELVRKLDDIRGDIAKVRAQFAEEFDQVAALRGIERQVRALATMVGSSWTSYALRETRDVVALFRLVRSLPDVRAALPRLAQLESALQAARASVPRTIHQLTDFDARCQELADGLSKIDGLSDAVKDFLRKVAMEQATLADVTDEVLAWCQRGERLHGFAVHFADVTNGASL